MSGKRKKGGHVAPPQSKTPKGTGKLKLVKDPVGDQEITEIDALKFRLAVQKDNNVTSSKKEIDAEQAALDQKKETLRLRVVIVRQENMREIEHLHIQAGDNVYEKDGKFFLKRAPQNPGGPGMPPGLPPGPPPTPTPDGQKAGAGDEGESK